ncbi:M81 family metallopeptidase [Neoroseomonas oryzicola]|uniref:Microcystinase C n=1 Tax=Neoroseomonas oryzicola TaxID=535904 RepID=A0A9X9WM39_9PROT|nr:M81 family metallopeptidase [Neoroseomonas oryzicola]MBR0661399.1 M81 family metallopeptidase [Neoroseomonas oryzicola]NKE19659.1 M81 family metallopeptidase [Neoroseomonas oryzicola]
MAGPRIALLGFSIECNRFAAPATKADFTSRCYLEGAAIVADARSAAPRALAEMPGFVADMDAAGPWQPLPILLAMAEPNGPVDAGFFTEMMAIWRRGLEAAKGQVDGVYCVMHGAGLTTVDLDPEGTLQALIREILGDIPLVCSYDLHANVSDRMVATTDAFVGYRTNPHLDMRERGAESAQLLRRLLKGERFVRAFRRLPIVAPTVSQLTAQGPYAEVIDLGQALAAKDARIANVSVMGGFAYGDTPFNGMAVIVTATDAAAAEALADTLANAAWDRRHRFVANLTSLEDAVRLAKDSPTPLAFADVADNPGGGGHGNTTWILEAFHKAGVEGALIGMMLDAPLAIEAHGLGVGARFTARFNRDSTPDDPFRRPFAAEAVVRAVSDGNVTGRRGIYAGTAMTLGRTVWLQISGLSVVVVEGRAQCADPVFFEHLGLDIGKARCIVVKSRGHFRGGFDEFFRHEQIVEVDCPGLTSPVLSRFPWKDLPRPVLPIDPEAHWP